ncbi:hypothetical protein [Frateuria terrea]|uniref:CBS domain-containing protein n=1 Tax=Frateuria terrea TaxID=529704 RepID=A0A1H6XD02_9GAMM|nr:hypothetical protein [Frateuria terrea]SEJ25364.1 hypothetical protein SAMN04487997_2840 [Frateuria terrea]SFP59882.1 hypothetical protein SAMN02927913_2817 [Frateuria terrea]
MPDEGAQRILDAYQASLPVRLIATKREEFAACRLDESIAEVLARNVGNQFDHLPVRHAGSGAILGVLCTVDLAEGPGHSLVSDCYQPLHEALLIGAEASILDFAREARQPPFRFIVDGQHISGLVSLSDLQQLPVRAALFAVITQLEMSTAEVIAAAFADGSWRRHLSVGRQQKLDRQWASAREEGNQMAPILYTQFCDKATLIRKLREPLGFGNLTAEEVEQDLSQLEWLRNQLAHGNEFAASRAQATAVCSLIHTMDTWLQRLADTQATIQDTISRGGLAARATERTMLDP